MPGRASPEVLRALTPDQLAALETLAHGVDGDADWQRLSGLRRTAEVSAWLTITHHVRPSCRSWSGAQQKAAAQLGLEVEALRRLHRRWVQGLDD